MVRPRGSIPISLPCRALTARGSLERQFRNGTRPGHRFHVFLICVYYITIKPVCQPQILPLLATLHTLFPKSPCAGGEEISPRYSFKGGLRAPFVSPRKGKGPLATPLRGGAPPPSPPPKGSLVLDLLQKGFPKNNTRLRLPLPARLCRATSPTGGGKSRLPLWGSCHGIAVTERGEPGTYSRPQPKIPERPSAEGFSLSSRVKLHFVQLTRSSKSRSAPLTRGHRPSPAPAPGSGSRRGAAGGWARRRGLRRSAPGPPGA